MRKYFYQKIFRVKRRYQLIVRLKAIKYKKDFLCYLSFYIYRQASPQSVATFVVSKRNFQYLYLHKFFIIFFVTFLVSWVLRVLRLSLKTYLEAKIIEYMV